MTKPKILLASRSPRRRELLHRIVDSFEVSAPEADEDIVCDTPEQTVIEVAKAKLAAVANPQNYDAVIVCDTLVYLDGIYYGKPKDEAEAKQMLTELSGRKHKVVSGFVVKAGDREIKKAVASYVTFYTLSEKIIEEYIVTEQPLDKAGSYAIQDGKLIASIDGDYTNVMGMPVDEVKKALQDLGIIE